MADFPITEEVIPEKRVIKSIRKKYVFFLNGGGKLSDKPQMVALANMTVPIGKSTRVVVDVSASFADALPQLPQDIIENIE